LQYRSTKKKREIFSPFSSVVFSVAGVFLAQKAGDFGYNTVPNLRNGTLVQRHKYRTDNDYDQYNDQPSCHLITGLIGQYFPGL
jgi:hypothetical protein